MPSGSGKLRAAAALASRKVDVASDKAIERPALGAEKLRSVATLERNADTDATANNSQNRSSSSAVNKSRPKAGAKKFKAAAMALKISQKATPWGDFAYLDSVDISSLSNEKLKRHLSARDEVAEGTKQELIERLSHSLEEERQRKIAVELELEAKHRKTADLEEKGALYVAGKNSAGQLGLGDLEDRHQFTVIPSTRGKRFRHVSTGGNMVLATTEHHEVYAWGGSGLGPSGLNCGLNSNKNGKYKTPQIVEKLNGEEVVLTSIGANHACAASIEGDLFVWHAMGYGFGVLGRGDDPKHNINTPQPQYLDTITVTSIDCGEMHTAAVHLKENAVYTWGHCANGRLGCGKCDDKFKATPFRVRLPSLVKFVTCGSEHTVLCTQSAVYSFGCGDGGRLGHGSDCSDQYEPREISSLRGSNVLSMSAGTWHSACIVHVPPLGGDCGWLYIWGRYSISAFYSNLVLVLLSLKAFFTLYSGFQGQLGLGQTCKATSPTVVQDFVDAGLSVKQIFCSSHHNAAIAHDGNLYTWGSNKYGALGRSIDGAFTPHPGIVADFGTIVNRIGRGLPRTVACGREYTIVATHPYDGPSEEEALRLTREQRLREMEEEKRRNVERQAREEELKRLQDIEAEKNKIRYLTSKRLCTMDPKCPGFTYEPNQPSICRECGFSVVYHTIVADDLGNKK